MEEFIPGRKGCNDRWDVVIGWIGVVSHHLGSLLGAIELTFLCAFVCKVGYFDASRGFDLLVSLGNVNIIMKQLVFLVISSTMKILYKFQPTPSSRINLFSLLSIYLPYHSNIGV